MSQDIQDSKDNQEKKAGFFIPILSFFSFFIVPFLLGLFLLFSLLTCPEFYTSILRNSNLIETFVKAKNLHAEEKIRDFVEKEVHLEKFRNKYKFIKTEFNKLKEKYYDLNRHHEFNKLEKERDALSDLSWKRAPDQFNDEEEFEKYKSDRLDKLDKQIDEIILYRDINKKEIEKMEETLEKAEDAFEDAEDILEDKIDDANDILDSQRESFSGGVYADLDIISPILTEELNNKLIDVAVQREIEKIISYFENYYEQMRIGNVYVDRLDNFLTGDINSKKIKFPDIEISLWVEDEVKGVLQKRHLLSEIFVEKARRTKNLKNRKTFIKLFKFADTSLGEMIGGSYLKDYHFTISNGVIRSRPIIFKKAEAEIVENIMIAFTWGKYLKYVFPVCALLVLVFLFFSSAEKREKHRHLIRILLYPSSIIIITCLFLIIFSGSVFNIFPDLIASPIWQTYYKSILMVTAVHMFAPVVALFILFIIAGIVLKIRAGKTA